MKPFESDRNLEEKQVETPYPQSLVGGYAVFDETLDEHVRSFNLAYFGMRSSNLSVEAELGADASRSSQRWRRKEQDTLNKAIRIFNYTETIIERTTDGIINREKIS